jgi:subtilase family serine protease
MGLSAEWINFQTKYATAGGTSAAAPISANRTAKSDQYMLTATYFF